MIEGRNGAGVLGRSEGHAFLQDAGAREAGGSEEVKSRSQTPRKIILSSSAGTAPFTVISYQCSVT